MNKNKEIEKLLQETDIFPDMALDKDAIYQKALLQKQERKETIGLRRFSMPKKIAVSIAAVLVVTLFTTPTFGQEVQKFFHHVIQQFSFSQSMTIHQIERSSEADLAWAKRINETFEGQVFDENGEPVEFFVFSSDDTFTWKDQPKYTADGEKILGTDFELTDGSTKWYPETQSTRDVKWYSGYSLDEIPSIFPWEYTLPTYIPDGFAFNRFQVDRKKVEQGIPVQKVDLIYANVDNPSDYYVVSITDTNEIITQERTTSQAVMFVTDGELVSHEINETTVYIMNAELITWSSEDGHTNYSVDFQGDPVCSLDPETDGLAVVESMIP